MISTILFSLSALCFGLMFTPGKPTSHMKPTKQVYTYYVCGDEPMPTWKRKEAPRPRVTTMVG
jgi:hypothetical protein